MRSRQTRAGRLPVKGNANAAAQQDALTFFADVPRDSAGQYLWARKGGTIFPVVSKSAESPEFMELLPGESLRF